jgi:hypothetical protein
MSDFVVVLENHTFIMNAPEVAKETVAFLRTGQFDHRVPRVERASVGGLAGLWLAP